MDEHEIELTPERVEMGRDMYSEMQSYISVGFSRGEAFELTKMTFAAATQAALRLVQTPDQAQMMTRMQKILDDMAHRWEP
jgi:hypothetical protein